MADKSGGNRGHKGNPNSLANLRPQWTSEDQPANRGRKPSKLKKFISDNHLTSDDVRNMCKYILPLDENQLKELTLDTSKPISMRIFARSVLEDFKKKDIKNIMNLMNRAFGMPKESINLNAETTEQVCFYIPDNGRDSESEENE